MSEEGYKPSDEEVAKAEENLASVPELDKLSERRKKIMESFGEIGVSEETVIKAWFKEISYEVDGSKTAFLIANGHDVCISYVHEQITECYVDEVKIEDPKDTSRILKAVLLFGELKKLEISVGPEDSKRVVESAAQKAKVQEALSDIFK